MQTIAVEHLRVNPNSRGGPAGASERSAGVKVAGPAAGSFGLEQPGQGGAFVGGQAGNQLR